MIRTETDFYICRMWIALDPNDDPYHYKSAAFNALQYLHSDPLAAERMIKQLCEYDKRVNSVEVVERNSGCGICVHKNWP